ncbi:tellurite resistance TerB family protein [Paracoccus sediminilitoris]|uniref:tellurite resistance TerB family protein n=1 Tax=Paracoccus sediminilitoris TaxID=2202419 RepID=UPI000DBAA0E5|nr:TerB family tellurite resistance protein [Paracoccus sediminilitoris]
MFKDILALLMGDAIHPEPMGSQEAELAIAALLVRVARSDDSYDDAERMRIDRVLARRHGLTPEEAADRRAQAEALEAQASDTVRFTRQIKDRIALEDRAGVLAALWEVAYADETRAADEESLIRLVAGLLGVPDQQSAQIRQQVLERMGLPRG